MRLSVDSFMFVRLVMHFAFNWNTSHTVLRLKSGRCVQVCVLILFLSIPTDCKISLISNNNNYRSSIKMCGVFITVGPAARCIQRNDSIHNKLYYLWLGKQFCHCHYFYHHFVLSVSSGRSTCWCWFCCFHLKCSLSFFSTIVDVWWIIGAENSATDLKIYWIAH